MKPITKSYICGVTCFPGKENCNNYCNHDKSKEMPDNPLTYNSGKQEIKSKEEIINECAEKYNPSLRVISHDMNVMIEAAMETYASLTTIASTEKLTIEEDYKEVIEDHKRLVREIDVILNGKDAAKQASLCDLVSEIQGIASKEKEYREALEKIKTVLDSKSFGEISFSWYKEQINTIVTKALNK